MLARRSMLVVVNSLLGALLGYVGLLAVARFMGAEIVGGKAYALALVYLVGTLARLGFPTTHARRLGSGQDVAHSIGTYALLKLGMTTVFAGVALGAAWIWFGLLDRPVTDITLRALWLAMGVMVVRSLRDIIVNTFRGLHLIAERETVLLVNTLVTVLLTVVSAVAYAWSHGRWSPLPRASAAAADLLGATGPVSIETGLAWVLTAFLAGEVAALFAAAYLLRRARVPVAGPRRAIAVDYFRATLPLMMVAVGAVLLKRIDQVMIGFWYDPHELGQYAAAMTLSDLLLLVAFGIEVTMLPEIARLDRAGDKQGMLDVLRHAERWISLLIWPVIVLAALVATPIMHILLSDDFLEAAPVFIILCAYAFFQSLRVPMKTKAIGIGKHGYAARVATAAVAANIVLNLVFIPTSLGPIPTLGLGALGAAISTLLTGILMFLAFRIRMHRWTGHPMLHIALVKHAVAAAATWGVLRLAMAWPGLPAIDRFYDLLWFGALVLGTYLLLLRMMSEFGKADLQAALGMLRRPTTPKRQQ